MSGCMHKKVFESQRAPAILYRGFSTLCIEQSFCWPCCLTLIEKRLLETQLFYRLIIGLNIDL